MSTTTTEKNPRFTPGDRDETIKIICKALKDRSGKTWSVTGGRGTGWGWIRISAPPARCNEFGTMTDQDAEELAGLLGLDARAHHQGVSIPAAADYRREYINRALCGEPRGEGGKQYWD